MTLHLNTADSSIIMCVCLCNSPDTNIPVSLFQNVRVAPSSCDCDTKIILLVLPKFPWEPVSVHKSCVLSYVQHTHSPKLLLRCLWSLKKLKAKAEALQGVDIRHELFLLIRSYPRRCVFILVVFRILIYLH